MSHKYSRSSRAVLAAVSVLLAWPLTTARPEAQLGRPEIPITWDEAALADWPTPVAGLNIRPTHISGKDYYSLPIENLRTYPVYFPGKEPKGYWEMLQRAGPQPLIEPEKLKTETDWVEAGRRVFDEADHLHLRTLDPTFVDAARSLETYTQAGAEPLPDGTVFGSGRDGCRRSRAWRCRSATATTAISRTSRTGPEFRALRASPKSHAHAIPNTEIL